MRVSAVRGGRAMTVGAAVLMVVIAVGVFMIASNRFKTDSVSEQIDAGGPILVVFLLPIGNPSPSLELLIFDVNTGRAGLLFVPGSVGMVVHERQRVDAIATLYNPETLEKLMGRLGTLLGLNLSFYLDLSFKGIARLVDILGGIELLIPEPVQAAAGDRRILLPSGNVTLDGDMASDYLSLQADGESDAERVERVHQLMQALLRSIVSGDELLSDPEVRQMLYESVSTNMDRQAFETLLVALDKLDADRVILLRTLGRNQMVSGRSLLFPHEEGTLIRDTVAQTVEALARPLGSDVAELSVSVEVLNGTHANGLAAQAGTVLESFGYEVVTVANANHNEYERTLVISRRGDQEEAQQVAMVIDCAEDLAQWADLGEDILQQSSVDVTVILGRDFNGRSCETR